MQATHRVGDLQQTRPSKDGVLRETSPAAQAFQQDWWAGGKAAILETYGHSAHLVQRSLLGRTHPHSRSVAAIIRTEDGHGMFSTKDGAVPALSVNIRWPPLIGLGLLLLYRFRMILKNGSNDRIQ